MEYKLPKNFTLVRIFSSEISDGSMALESREQKLPKFLAKYSIKSPVASCEQVHSNKIEIVNKAGDYAGCDGLATGEKIALFVKSADCVPLLFSVSSGGGTWIGAVHAGRRSLGSGIISTSLKQVFEKISQSPAEARFFIGPHIRRENYEIKEDAITPLPDRLKKFVVGDQKKFFDLTQATVSDLVLIGAKRENIFDSEIDTFMDARFFSYRKGEKGLFVTLITIN